MIAVLALGVAGCPTRHPAKFAHQDFSVSPPLPSVAVAIGKDTVVRVTGGSGRRPSAVLWIDVFPSAALRGAWLQTVRGGWLYEGAATIYPSTPEHRYTVRWNEETDAARPVRQQKGPDSTTAWLSVCGSTGCETFVIGDDDWSDP